LLPLTAVTVSKFQKDSSGNCPNRPNIVDISTVETFSNVC
jgi:hypothetical protein